MLEWDTALLFSKVKLKFLIPLADGCMRTRQEPRTGSVCFNAADSFQETKDRQFHNAMLQLAHEYRIGHKPGLHMLDLLAED